MKRISTSLSSHAVRSARFACQSRPAQLNIQRSIQSSSSQSASVAPITAAGPPPGPPIPEPSAINKDDRIARKAKQAKLLKSGQDMRSIGTGKGGSAATKRFWKDVDVVKKDGMYCRFTGENSVPKLIMNCRRIPSSS